MQNKKSLLLSGLIALFLLFGLIAPQSARAQTGVTLSFNPAEVTATTCGNVEISLDVAGVTEANPMTGYHLEVTYDEEVVEVVSVENGGFLTDTEVLPAFYEPTNTVDDGTGRILFGMAQRGVNGNPVPKSGSGSLIKITLKAKVAGGSTTFVIDADDSMLVDWPDAFVVDFTVDGTSVVTTASCSPTTLELYPNSVKENELVGTTVGSFSATDIDPGETFTYSFVENGTYPDNTLFTIDGSVLKTAVVFNHEEKAVRLIKVRVTDSTGLTFDQEFSIDILDINEAPILDPIGPQTVMVNQKLNFTATALDPEGNPLTWSLGVGAPTGAIIDPAAGEFSWDTTGFEPGDYSFDVCVSDSVYLVCETITVTVEAVPDPQPIKLYLPLIFK